METNKITSIKPWFVFSSEKKSEPVSKQQKNADPVTEAQPNLSLGSGAVRGESLFRMHLAGRGLGSRLPLPWSTGFGRRKDQGKEQGLPAEFLARGSRCWWSAGLARRKDPGSEEDLLVEFLVRGPRG